MIYGGAYYKKMVMMAECLDGDISAALIAADREIGRLQNTRDKGLETAATIAEDEGDNDIADKIRAAKGK